MQILRKPPYPLSVSYTVPEASTEYILVIEDLLEQTETEIVLQSNSSSVLTYALTEEFTKYDKSYPTIDHKISVFNGFINNISPEEISQLENLCITKRTNNSKKNSNNILIL